MHGGPQMKFIKFELSNNKAEKDEILLYCWTIDNTLYIIFSYCNIVFPFILGMFLIKKLSRFTSSTEQVHYTFGHQLVYAVLLNKNFCLENLDDLFLTTF